MNITKDATPSMRKMKTSEIIKDLRNKIVHGEFTPGDELPRRHELLGHYGISVSAFQKCINKLNEEGFLESRGIKGTVVKKYPPHLYCFGLVLPTKRDTPSTEWDSFWHVMVNAANTLVNNDNRFSFNIYYCGSEDSLDLSRWQDFLDDAKFGRISGAIVLTPIPNEIMAELGNIAVVRPDSHEYKGTNEVMIDFDYVELFDKALGSLIEKGCKQIAVFTNSAFNIDFQTRIVSLLKKRKVYCPTEWIHGIALTPREIPWVSRIVQLLFSENQKKVPDGIIVLNENILPYIQETFLHLGFVAGHDVHVVSHCNIPLQRPPFKGVDYWGFDSSKLIDKSIKLFSMHRKGESKHINRALWIKPIQLIGDMS